MYNSPPIGAKRNVANRAPHPLNDAGKEIAYLIKSSRKISFIPNRLMMATYGLGFDSETGSGTADGDSFKLVVYRRAIKFAPLLARQTPVLGVNDISPALLAVPTPGTNAAVKETWAKQAIARNRFLIFAARIFGLRPQHASRQTSSVGWCQTLLSRTQVK